jgi:Holliday junction resolvase RusA-like endonuclease
MKHDIYFKIQKETLKDWISQDLTLNLNCYFFWSPDQVFTKGKKALHKVKRKDVSNRVKPLHDAIAEAFDIDDMFFFKHSEEKCTDDRGLLPYVLIEIKPHKPRTIHNIMKELNGT